MEERVEFTMSDVIPEELLAGLSDTDREMESINRPSISYWRNCWIRLKKDKLAMLGIAIVVLMTLAAIFVPMFSPYTYDQTDFGNALQWPNSAHLFGTDKMGRDIFVRTMYGARISLSGVGTGVYDDVRDVSKKLARCGRVTVPDEEEAAVYRRYHDLYDRLYDHMKQDFNDLYEL